MSTSPFVLRFLPAFVPLFALAASGAEPDRRAFGGGNVLKGKIRGNYEMSLVVAGKVSPGDVSVLFSANEALSECAYLRLCANGFTVGRKRGDKTTTWREFKGAGGPPWRIRVAKKGNFFRFRVNEATRWMRGPLGEWQGCYEPCEGSVGVQVPAGAAVESWTVTTLPWLQQATRPVVPGGPRGSFYEQQAIPGAIIERGGKHFMYFMAGMKGDEEGASRRTIGVAVSTNLKDWKVHPEPVVRSGEPNFPHDNIYPSGAVVTPDGKIAIIYAAQKFPEWTGFGLATADGPLGPFTQHPGNPVYRHFTHAHEFDLVRVDGPRYRYVMFYAGFTPKPERGKAGDRGYLLYSDDLVSWRADKRNPVFGPETLDNWDAIHVRPRSLSLIGDTWYLWYEGCNTWSPPGKGHHGWWDTVGLARSKDLVEWEYYPRNPALPGLGVGAGQFDSSWVGWPRMVVKDGIAHVFYAGGAQVGLRTIPVERLTDWSSEGGRTINVHRQFRPRLRPGGGSGRGAPAQTAVQ